MEVEQDRLILASITEVEQDSPTLPTTMGIVQDQGPPSVLLLTEEAADLLTLEVAGHHQEEALVELGHLEDHQEVHLEDQAEGLHPVDPDQEVINN